MLVHLLTFKGYLMKKKISKYSFSLLEIMIVIFLIGLIGGTIGYNMKGSLDKGREFKTKESIRQISDILLLEVAEGEEIENVVENPEKYLEKSGLVKNPEKLLKDGWGGRIDVKIKGNELVVSSDNLKKFESKKKK